MEHRVSKGLWALFFTLVFFSCSPSTSTSKNQKVRKKELRILQEARHEPGLDFFWREISSPSFLFSRDIHWACAERERVLVLEWNKQKTLCKDLLIGLEEKHAGQCLHEKKRKLSIESCEKIAIEKILSKFRLSPFDALYGEKEGLFAPNAYLELEKKWHLPELRFAESGNVDLDFPQLEEWLAASEERALLSLRLQGSGSGLDQWLSFAAWYAKLDPPSKLKWIANPPAPNGKRLRPWNALPVLKARSNFPLEMAACAYVESWLQSRFLVAGHRVEARPVFTVDCQILAPGQGKPAEESLEVTRLPLPLITTIGRQFPFTRSDNILDESIWNTLGALKQ
jgi:hypothetical protein